METGCFPREVSDNEVLYNLQISLGCVKKKTLKHGPMFSNWAHPKFESPRIYGQGETIIRSHEKKPSLFARGLWVGKFKRFKGHI